MQTGRKSKIFDLFQKRLVLFFKIYIRKLAIMFVTRRHCRKREKDKES